jgi:hypothetical protein
MSQFYIFISVPVLVLFNYFWSKAVMSRDSSVGIATGYELDDQGGGNSSLSRITSRPALGCTQPPINGYRGLFPGGKEAGA